MAFVVREPTRKVHITRILGTNRAGDVLPDIWADVERFEQYTKVTQSYPANQYQQTITKFRWHDDPEDADEYRPEDDDGTARDTVVLKVCSPDEEDLDDPEEWIPVRVIKRVHLTHGDEVGSDTNHKYITEDLTAERKVETRRVLHYDTSIDDAAEAAFEADPARRAYVVNSSDYQKDDETKDEDQYVEFEIVTAITKQSSEHAQSNGTDQQVIQHFKNQYLIDETEEALLEEVGNQNKNPPYRLDPFQNIVNVQWTFTVYAIIVSEGSYATVDPDKGATLLETHSDPAITGITGAPVTAALIQCSANIGENFASINLSAGSPGAAERLEVIVVPKSDEARDDWFNLYVVPVSRDRIRPTAPFLWHLNTMLFTAARLVQFKLRYAPHIIGPTAAGSVPIVEMYPSTTAIGGATSLTGYGIWSYRTDRKGEDALFMQPPEWSISIINFFGHTGLLFGTDPPLIAADVPLPP